MVFRVIKHILLQLDLFFLFWFKIIFDSLSLPYIFRIMQMNDLLNKNIMSQCAIKKITKKHYLSDDNLKEPFCLSKKKNNELLLLFTLDNFFFFWFLVAYHEHTCFKLFEFDAGVFQCNGNEISTLSLLLVKRIIPNATQFGITEIFIVSLIYTAHSRI